MEWNVRDSGGTVIFSLTPTLTGGSKKTVAFAITLQLARAVSDSALSDQLLKAGQEAALSLAHQA
jgi:hypothetical protein